MPFIPLCILLIGRTVRVIGEWGMERETREGSEAFLTKHAERLSEKYGVPIHREGSNGREPFTMADISG